MFRGSLPLEIQTYILEALVLDGNAAQYASICRTWQTIIERKNFAHLTVTRSRLADFSDIGYRHRHLVKHIWYSIEPDESECWECGPAKIHNWRLVSTRPVRKAIRDLVKHLSVWEPRGSLLLDISVRAPSSLMDFCGIMQYGPCVIPELKKTEIIQCSDWRHYRGSYRRPVSGSLELLPKLRRKRKPKVTAVTSLLLSRQSHYIWESEALEETLDLFPEVHEIQYEPYHFWRRGDIRPTNTATMRLCRSLKTDRLRRMVLFESIQCDNMAMFLDAQTAELDAAKLEATERETAFALVEASLGLEHLAASFVSDASHVFDACFERNSWPRLESLTLTSNVLDPQQEFIHVNKLLKRMALVAMKMPRLKSMELWNGRGGFAGAFQYQLSESHGTAKITWRGTWDLPLEPLVLTAWQAVASRRVHCGLQVATEILDANLVIISSGDAIRHLMLLNTVIHPVSLWQIQKETTHQGNTIRCS